MQGGTEQVSGHLPYVKYLWVEPGAILSLIAQKENYAGGTITCEIWIRGEKTKTSTSSAEYGVVTCSDVAQ